MLWLFFVLLHGYVVAACAVTAEDLGVVAKEVGKMLKEKHFSRRAPDDALSRAWLRGYIDMLDPGRR